MFVSTANLQAIALAQYTGYYEQQAENTSIEQLKEIEHQFDLRMAEVTIDDQLLQLIKKAWLMMAIAGTLLCKEFFKHQLEGRLVDVDKKKSIYQYDYG